MAPRNKKKLCKEENAKKAKRRLEKNSKWPCFAGRVQRIETTEISKGKGKTTTGMCKGCHSMPGKQEKMGRNAEKKDLWKYWYIHGPKYAATIGQGNNSWGSFNKWWKRAEPRSRSIDQGRKEIVYIKEKDLFVEITHTIEISSALVKKSH